MKEWGKTVTDTFDFVVVGGGSGGCAVAGRLSEDPQTSVALLEAGGKNDNWVVTTPGALVLMVVRQSQQLGVRHRAAGRASTAASAISRAARGSAARPRSTRWSISAATAAITTNGPRSAIPAGPMPTCCPTSSARKTMPISTANITARAARSPVNKLRSDNPVQETFLQAAREAQFRIRDDFNAEEQEGLGIYQVTQKNGERWSAARGYIHPLSETARQSARRDQRPCHAHPVRRQARGRRRIPAGQGAAPVARAPRSDPVFRRVSDAATADAVRRRRRHGAGASTASRPSHHLPGVGQNLQDHPDFVFGYISDNPHFTGLSFNGIAHQLRAIGQYRRERRGPMTSNFAECGGFLKTRPDLDVPDIQLHFGMAMVDDHGRKRHLGQRLFLPRLPAAAEEPRQRFAWQRRSGSGAR